MNHSRSLLVAVSSTFITEAGATPSGLNNIPTADTVPQSTLVGQAFSTFGSGTDDFWLSSKTGLDLGPANVEVGLTSRMIPDKAGPLTGHAKIALPIGEGLPAIAVGAANIAFSGADEDRAGQIFSYAMLSHDFGWLRLHGGVSLQDEVARPFFGIDKTFRSAATPAHAATGKGVVSKGVSAGSPEIPGRDLFTLRADGIHSGDDSWLYSAGALIPITHWLVFETWVNFPDDGQDVAGFFSKCE